MRHLLFFVLFLLLKNFALAQYKSGYLIEPSNDTLRGLFNIDSRNNEVYFKAFDTSVHSRKINIDSIEYLQWGNKYFQSWKGARNMCYMDKFTYNILNVDSSYYQTILLTYLYKGKKISLLTFNDDFEHFFVEYRNKTKELIMQYRYLTSFEVMKMGFRYQSPSFYTLPYYKNLLSSLIRPGTSPQMLEEINTSEYEYMSLLRLIKKLDQLL